MSRPDDEQRAKSIAVKKLADALKKRGLYMHRVYGPQGRRYNIKNGKSTAATTVPDGAELTEAEVAKFVDPNSGPWPFDF